MGATKSFVILFQFYCWDPSKFVLRTNEEFTFEKKIKTVWGHAVNDEKLIFRDLVFNILFQIIGTV